MVSAPLMRDIHGQLTYMYTGNLQSLGMYTGSCLLNYSVAAVLFGISIYTSSVCPCFHDIQLLLMLTV